MAKSKGVKDDRNRLWLIIDIAVLDHILVLPGLVSCVLLARVRPFTTSTLLCNRTGLT